MFVNKDMIQGLSALLLLVLVVALVAPVISAPAYGQVIIKPLPTVLPTVLPTPIPTITPIKPKPIPVPIELRPTDTAVLKVLIDNDIDVQYVQKVDSDSLYSERYESILGSEVIEVFTCLMASEAPSTVGK